MKIRIPEFVGFRDDPKYPVPVKVFSSVAEPTYPLEERLTELMGASAERTLEIKAEFQRYLEALEAYRLDKPRERFDEDIEEAILTNNELFAQGDSTEVFREKTGSRRWTARDQVDYDYEGKQHD